MLSAIHNYHRYLDPFLTTPIHAPNHPLLSFSPGTDTEWTVSVLSVRTVLPFSNASDHLHQCRDRIFSYWCRDSSVIGVEILDEIISSFAISWVFRLTKCLPYIARLTDNFEQSWYRVVAIRFGDTEDELSFTSGGGWVGERLCTYVVLIIRPFSSAKTEALEDIKHETN